MQDRQPTNNPIFRDLLTQGITEQQLTAFLQGLFTSVDAHQPIKDTDEINQPVFYNRSYYHTALVYATRLKSTEIVKALLNIGAHPNVYNDSVSCGSALLLSMQKRTQSEEIFALFLAMTDINIFVMAPLRAAYDFAQGNTVTISRLLKADQQISMVYSSEEINSMAATIAISWKANETNFVVCQQLANIYGTNKEAEELPRIISEECKMTASGTPPVLASVIQSYLFHPKPASVKRFQENYENAAPFKPVSLEENKPFQPVSLEENKPDSQRRNCSVM